MSLEEKYEEVERQIGEKAREFDPKFFRADAINEIFIEGSRDGKKEVIRVRFGQLLDEEYLEVARHPPEEQVYYTLYFMLRKAYPDITIEDVKKMETSFRTILMSEIYKRTNFFILREHLSKAIQWLRESGFYAMSSDTSSRRS